jgi:hypothetical protein
MFFEDCRAAAEREKVGVRFATTVTVFPAKRLPGVTEYWYELPHVVLLSQTSK